LGGELTATVVGGFAGGAGRGIVALGSPVFAEGDGGDAAASATGLANSLSVKIFDAPCVTAA
jgi:hypothetical protein